MRKALCVGIDCYEHADDLHGCVNDANSVKAALERNGDGTLNFEVKLMCATSEASYINRNDLRDAIENLFKTDSEIAVLYYSGHGSFDALGGYLCTSEIQRPDEGVSLNEVMGFVAQSKAIRSLYWIVVLVEQFLILQKCRIILCYIMGQRYLQLVDHQNMLQKKMDMAFLLLF